MPAQAFIIIVYLNFDTKLQDSTQGESIHAIIGSATEEDTISLSTVSKRHEMPIMGYVAESGELSDKVWMIPLITLIF